MSIQVTKPFLPPIEEYHTLIESLWDSHMLSNNGLLVQQLEQSLKKYLGADHFLFCTNGTIALQLAIKALRLSKEIITTPFSYVATTNSILWENCTPVFVDINADNFCIDADKIEEKITENTEAILATHVFGHPCNIDKIDAIAKKYNLKVIYDAAHSFGSLYKNKSLLTFGDITASSFHATKVFHTIEGGCVITNNSSIANELIQKRDHGFLRKESKSVGTNARQSELHAAMGICNLKYIDQQLQKRKQDSALYHAALKDTDLSFPKITQDEIYNYAYFPVVFPNEQALLKAIERLKERDIFCRRYFFPSLNKLSYLANTECIVADDISKRILCLPMAYDLSEENIKLICSLLLFQGI